MLDKWINVAADVLISSPQKWLNTFSSDVLTTADNARSADVHLQTCLPESKWVKQTKWQDRWSKKLGNFAQWIVLTWWCPGHCTVAVDGHLYTASAPTQPALPPHLPRLSALRGRWPSRTFLNLAVLLSTSGPFPMLFPLFEMLFPLNLSTHFISSGKAFLSLRLGQALLLHVPQVPCTLGMVPDAFLAFRDEVTQKLLYVWMKYRHEGLLC